MPCADVCVARALPGWTRHGLTPWYVALRGTASAGPNSRWEGVQLLVGLGETAAPFFRKPMSS